MISWRLTTLCYNLQPEASDSDVRT